MTSDPDERTSIASYRQIAANSAGFIVASLAIPMVRFFGHGDDARGYQYTMGLLSALSVIFFIVAFFATKERIQPDPQQKTNLGQDLSDLFKNRPWVVLFLATLFYFTAIVIRGNVMLPYFRFVAGNVDLFAWFNGFGLASLLVGVACSTAVSIRVGKRQLFIGSMLLSGIFNMALFIIPPSSTVVIIVCGSASPVRLWIVGPHHLGDDGRRGRLRRMEDGPPRQWHGYRCRCLRTMGRSRSRRCHCRLALFFLRIRFRSRGAVGTCAVRYIVDRQHLRGTRVFRCRRMPVLLSHIARRKPEDRQRAF